MADNLETFTRKYRPKRYSEMVGNTRMIRSILKASNSKNRPQVALFIGPAGSGKTTNARLMAKEYRCTNRTEKGSCGECPSCLELDHFIETGDSQDLMYVREIDASEGGGKQGIEAILEDASIASFDGSWKVYIIDECHTMTQVAQNRLLKNLEEPAENVLIILATTDPQKLLAPIISRCQLQLEVEKPSREELGKLLVGVCKAESIPYDTRGISAICVASNFEPRGSLHKLQLVYTQEESAKYESVSNVLTVRSEDSLYKFIEFLTQEDINTLEYIQFLSELKSKVKMKDFIEDIINFTKRGIYVINGARVDALDKEEITRYSKLFKKFTQGNVLYLMNLLVDIQKNSNVSDIESNLMVLGYKGIPKDNHIKNDVDEVQSNTQRVQKDEVLNHILTKTTEEEGKSIKDNNTSGQEGFMSKLGGLQGFSKVGQTDTDDDDADETYDEEDYQTINEVYPEETTQTNNNTRIQVTPKELLESNLTQNASNERSKGVETYRESMKPREGDVQELMNAHSQDTDVEGVAEMFNGSIVKGQEG